MTCYQKKKVGILLLGAHLSCFVLAEVLHTHHQQRALPGTESFTTHSCGEVELHRPLEWISQCALCRDGHSRVLVVQESSEPGLTISPTSVFLPPNEALQTEACLHTGFTRGPPAI